MLGQSQSADKLTPKYEYYYYRNKKLRSEVKQAELSNTSQNVVRLPSVVHELPSSALRES
jgi:hypothetical protein